MWLLPGSTLLIMAVGVFRPMDPLAGYFEMQGLPWSFFAWLAGILFSNVVLTSLTKRTYFRRFGWQ